VKPGARRPDLRLALNQQEAAAALGVSPDFFQQHLRHELRCVRRGRRRLYPVGELQRWLDDNASRALGERDPPVTDANVRTSDPRGGSR
jgi:hypothetical protein